MMHKFIKIPQGSWPQSQFDPKRTAVYFSTEFLVQVFNESNGIVRLSINKTHTGNDGRWVDGIAWEELQEIKNQCGYADYDAVEIYPSNNDVVNVANMRHLWVMPQKLDFVWRKPQ